MRGAVLMIAVLGSGCTLIEEGIHEVVPAEEVSVIDVEVQRGVFRYTGTSTEDIQISGSAIGRPSDEPGERSKTDWAIGQNGETLYLYGDSFGVTSGVNYDVVGPPHVHTDIDLRHGDVELVGITGSVAATGGYIYAHGLTGSVDLFARWHGVDAHLDPRPGSSIEISANGDVCLAVPAGRSYNISVWGDEDYGVFVNVGPWGVGTWGSYYAWSGPDAINIDVTTSGGEVYIYPAEWGSHCW